MTFDLANGEHGSFNPLDGADADSMAALLLQLCATGLTSEDRAELGDQIEAIVPALIELRDAGYVRLNLAQVVSHAKLDGFTRLAGDERISPLSRARCAAIRNRMIARGVKALLGHL